MAVAPPHADPRYITTAGFGCIFQNFGTGPASAEEPTIITKFFGKDPGIPDAQTAYSEEKVSHGRVIARCGNVPDRLATIFGVDLNPGVQTLVKGYRRPFSRRIDPAGTMGVVDIGVNPLTGGPDFPDIAPRKLCETPNYKHQVLHYPTDSVSHPAGGPRRYRVIKMNNMGVELYDRTGVDAMSVIGLMNLFENFVILHTGMIHNDVKGNNMMIHPATGQPSIIDFGLCTPFTLSAVSDAARAQAITDARAAGTDEDDAERDAVQQIPVPPYSNRTFEGLNGVMWFAYPPEYNFTSIFNVTEDIAPLTDDLFNQIGLTSQGYGTSLNFYLQKIAGEADDAHGQRIRGPMTAIYNDYFAQVPAVISRDMRNLQTAVTGDVYAVGLELYNTFSLFTGHSLPSAGLTAQLIELGPAHDPAAVTCDQPEFIKRLNRLLTATHPRVRPLHINILRHFDEYNARPGPVTRIMVRVAGAAAPVFYTSVKCLGGIPAELFVDEGMALGVGGCPVTRQEVEDNYMVYYYLIHKSRNEIVAYLDNTFDFATILQDAQDYWANHGPPAAPPPPPAAPGGAPGGAPGLLPPPGPPPSPGGAGGPGVPAGAIAIPIFGAAAPPPSPAARASAFSIGSTHSGSPPMPARAAPAPPVVAGAAAPMLAGLDPFLARMAAVFGFGVDVPVGSPPGAAPIHALAGAAAAVPLMAGSYVAIPISPGSLLGGRVGAAGAAAPAIGSPGGAFGALVGGSRGQRGGKTNMALYIPVYKSGKVAQSLINAGILAPGVYIAMRKVATSKAIEETLLKFMISEVRGEKQPQAGGRKTLVNALAYQPENALRQKVLGKQGLAKTQRVRPSVQKVQKDQRPSKRSNKTQKQKLKRVVAGLNSNLHPRMSMRNSGEMPNYSSDQSKVFLNQILSAPMAGKINMISHYYLAFYPQSVQAEILSLLMLSPLADPVTISTVFKGLETGTAAGAQEVVEFLRGLKDAHLAGVSERLGFSVDAAAVEKEVVALVETYLAKQSNVRFSFLISFMRGLSGEVPTPKKPLNAVVKNIQAL